MMRRCSCSFQKSALDAACKLAFVLLFSAGEVRLGCLRLFSAAVFTKDGDMTTAANILREVTGGTGDQVRK